VAYVPNAWNFTTVAPSTEFVSCGISTQHHADIIAFGKRLDTGVQKNLPELLMILGGELLALLMVPGCKLGLSYREKEEENVKNYFATDPKYSFCIFDQSSDHFLEPSSKTARSASVWCDAVKQLQPAVLRLLFLYQGLPSSLSIESNSWQEANICGTVIIDEKNFPSDLVHSSIKNYLDQFTKSRRSTQKTACGNFLDVCREFERSKKRLLPS
jgi:hypothetical protein